MHILGIPDNYIDVKVSFGVIRNPSFGMMDDDWGSKKIHGKSHVSFLGDELWMTFGSQ